MSPSTSSLQPLIQLLIELILDYRGLVYYVLGLLTGPVFMGLLSRLPTQVVMRHVKRQSEAEDTYVTWLNEVERLADQIEHEIHTKGFEEDGTLPDETTEKFEDFIALGTGPTEPTDEFTDDITDIANQIKNVRNARTDATNAPSDTHAQQELEDLLEQIREQAATKQRELDRTGRLKNLFR